MKNTFEINQQANLADLGTLVHEAIAANEDGRADALRDILFDIHSTIYPNATRPATPEENAALTAGTPEKSRAIKDMANIETLSSKIHSFAFCLVHLIENAGSGEEYGLKSKGYAGGKVLHENTVEAALTLSYDILHMGKEVEGLVNY